MEGHGSGGVLLTIEVFSKTSPLWVPFMGPSTPVQFCPGCVGLAVEDDRVDAALPDTGTDSHAGSSPHVGGVQHQGQARRLGQEAVYGGMLRWQFIR
jgi:hypothetical protein